MTGVAGVINFPFKGIVERPYAQDLLVGVQRKQAPLRRLRFADLWLTQTRLTVPGMFGERYSTDEYPHVVSCGGELYLEDGHHRLILQSLRDGAESALVRWIALPEGGLA